MKIECDAQFSPCGIWVGDWVEWKWISRVDGEEVHVGGTATKITGMECPCVITYTREISNYKDLEIGGIGSMSCGCGGTTKPTVRRRSPQLELFERRGK